jgi:hypothetical protein
MVLARDSTSRLSNPFAHAGTASSSSTTQGIDHHPSLSLGFWISPFKNDFRGFILKFFEQVKHCSLGLQFSPKIEKYFPVPLDFQMLVLVILIIRFFTISQRKVRFEVQLSELWTVESL